MFIIYHSSIYPLDMPVIHIQSLKDAMLSARMSCIIHCMDHKMFDAAPLGLRLECRCRSMVRVSPHNIVRAQGMPCMKGIASATWH